MPNNVEVIRGAYEALAAGNVEAVLAAMAPDIVWNEAESFPYADGNPYVGPEAIVEGVFARLASEWVDFRVSPKEVLDAGDTVVALGRYTARHGESGRSLDIPFAHVWRLEDGVIRRFQQYTDTAGALAAVGS
jgi:ketosteroid isomerase-like protein